jgi:HSP20 family protein
MGLLQLKSGPFHRFGNRYATLFDSDHFLGRTSFEEGWLSKSAADVLENGKEIEVELTLPGFIKDEINIEIRDNEIHVSAERTNRIKEGTKIRFEGIPKKFERCFYLSPKMDQDNIEAKLENGILCLTIGYSKDATRSNQSIEIS